MRWREAHCGGRRSAISCHQRRLSSATSAGVRSSVIAALQYSVMPLTVAFQVSKVASIARSVPGAGPQIEAMGRPADPFTGKNVPRASEGDRGVIVTPARVLISPSP